MNASPREKQTSSHHGERAGRTVAGDMRKDLAFQLAGHTYAIPLASVVEITPNQSLNKLPHMPKCVEGLLDLRGTSIPVINLRARLSMPVIQEGSASNILVVNVAQQPVGFLVDKVDAVVSSTAHEHVPASPLLAGKEGFFVTGFLLLAGRVIALLDLAMAATSIALGRGVASEQQSSPLEQTMDEHLLQLIEMASEKNTLETPRIIPQVQGTIRHTEEEVTKILDRVEAMLNAAGETFQGIARIKEEHRLGRLKGQEALIADMEASAQDIQDQIFTLFQKLQFQDIARQRLEKVLRHIQGLQSVIGQKLRPPGQA